MKKNVKKGFTLTELIVVIVIIGILAAVLIPTLTGYINRAKLSNDESSAKHFTQAVYLETEAYTKEAPISASRVKELILAAGYSSDDLVPESKDAYFFYEVSTKQVVVLTNSDVALKAADGEYSINETITSPEALLQKDGEDVLLLGGKTDDELVEYVNALRIGNYNEELSDDINSTLKTALKTFVADAVFVKNGEPVGNLSNPKYVVFTNEVTTLYPSNFNNVNLSAATVVLPTSIAKTDLNDVVNVLKDASSLIVENLESKKALPLELQSKVIIGIGQTNLANDFNDLETKATCS